MQKYIYPVKQLPIRRKFSQCSVDLINCGFKGKLLEINKDQDKSDSWLSSQLPLRKSENLDKDKSID